MNDGLTRVMYEEKSVDGHAVTVWACNDAPTVEYGENPADTMARFQMPTPGNKGFFETYRTGSNLPLLRTRRPPQDDEIRQALRAKSARWEQVLYWCLALGFVALTTYCSSGRD